MKNILYALSFLMLFGVSCTGLDETVYDKLPETVFPENEDQVASMAVGAYAELQDLVDDAGWWFLAQETSSDELVFPTRGADWDDGGKWRVLHAHTWTNDVDAVNNMWNMFQSVSTCNAIVASLKALPQSEILDGKIKEVEVIRSFFYYLLIDNYGDVPYITSTEGIPDQPFSTPRAEIFDSITTQLENAQPLLKKIDNKFMATQYMVSALLAKLYMNAEVYTGTPQYGKANQYVDSVLAGPYRLEDDLMAPFFTENDNSPEIIFSINYDEDDVQGFRIHMRSLHYQSNLTFDMEVGPWNGCAVVKEFLDKYEETDARQGYFLKGLQTDIQGSPIMWEPQEGQKIQVDLDPVIPALNMDASFSPQEIKTSGARVIKYEIAKGAKENLSNNFVIFRLADFMLMKAELILTPGSGIVGDADAYINPIRTRAGVSTYTGATLNDLKEERAREMFLEGHRRQDLIRWGEFGNAWWEKPTDDKDRTIFPIPKWATDANPNLLLTE